MAARGILILRCFTHFCVVLILVSLLFSLAVMDTQTGLKFVSRDLVVSALPLMVEEHFALDLELLVIAKKLGFTEIVEVPVVIKRRKTSTVSYKAVVQMLADTSRVFIRSRVLGKYSK